MIACMRFYGAPRERAITYEIWKSYIHPDDLPEQEAQLKRSVRRTDGGKWFCGFCTHTKHVRYLHIAKAVTWGMRSNELKVVGTAIDITKRKQAELAIQQHAMQQGLIAAFGQQALASTDLDEFWDQAAVIACKVSQLISAKFFSLHRINVLLYLKAGSGWQEEWIGRHISTTDENTQNQFVLASHEPVIVEDFRTETRFKPSEILKTMAYAAESVCLSPELAAPMGCWAPIPAMTLRFTPGSISFLQKSRQYSCDRD